MDDLNEGVLVNDPSGRIVFVNAALAELLGFPEEAFPGRTIFDFMDEEGRRAAQDNLQRRARGEAGRFTHPWQARDGRRVWTMVSAKPAYDSDGRHIGSLVAVTDVTELKELQLQLDQAKHDLERRVEERTEALRREVADRREAEQRALRASEAKTGFLANMSHELRTPLNAILGYAELLQENPDDPLEDRLADLANIHGAGAQLLALIDDILDLSKIEQGALEFAREPFELSEITSDALHWLAREFESTGTHLEATHTPVSCIGDRRRVRQVIINLVSNALRYAPGRVAFASRMVGDQIQISVRDWGAGVPAAHRERIFEPFDQGAVRASSTGGTGLGLAICRRFARGMGGDVVLVDPGVGSEFVFTFSRELPTTASEP